MCAHRFCSTHIVHLCFVYVLSVGLISGVDEDCSNKKGVSQGTEA